MGLPNSGATSGNGILHPLRLDLPPAGESSRVHGLPAHTCKALGEVNDF